MKKISYPKFPNNLKRIDQFIQIKKNWEFSYNTLINLNKEFIKIFNENFTIIVAGSFGRMEASPSSDLDYFLLSDDKILKFENIQRRINNAVKKFHIQLPNPDGAFSSVVSIDSLISVMGGKEDDLLTLTKRMLLLMESKPLYNENLFKQKVEMLLKRYLQLIIDDPNKEALLLLNDLIRYFRSIAVNYEFNFLKEHQKWVLRNVKLRHSRILMYSGLLLLILNASKNTVDKYKYFLKNIYFTPLERIIHVYKDNNDKGYLKLLGLYNIFLRLISDPKIRNNLQIDYKDRFSNPYYSELKATSESFQSELTRFILTRKENWSQNVFEYLLF